MPYEFTDTENKTIGTAAERARAWGIVSLLFGALQLGMATLIFGRQSTFSLARLIASGIVHSIVGVVFIGAAISFAAVVKTRGDDVALMMRGLQKLSVALTIQVALTLVVLVSGFVLAGWREM